MEFASDFVLEEGEESDEEVEEYNSGGIELESGLDIAYDDGSYTGGFECEIMDFDEDEFPKPKSKSHGSSLNTVNLKLQVLKDEPPEQTMKEKFRYTCANQRVCGAFLSQIDTPIDIPDSNEKMWQCRFCGFQRTVKEWPEFKDVPNGDILFVNDLDSIPDLTLDPGDNTVVFVLDCSGSMSYPVDRQALVTSRGMMGGMGMFGAMMGLNMMPQQVPQGPTRLEALRDGVVAEIKKLKISSPKTKVGLVYFHNDVVVVGDGSHDVVNISGTALNDYNVLLTTGQRQASLGTVAESCDKLVTALQQLREGGQTALGPALVVSMAMAAKSKTSKLVLCTDGFANIGLGNIQGGVSSRQTDEFYKDVATHCKTSGVSVSVISFDECGYAKAMGELPVETGGLLWRVDSSNSDLKINDVLTRRTMATDAFVRFVVNKQLYIANSENEDDERSNFTHLLGNIHDNMSQAFKFGFRSDEKSKKQRQDVKDPNGLLNEKPRESTVTITDITDKDTEKTDKQETPSDKTNGDASTSSDKQSSQSLDEKTGAVVLKEDLNKEYVPFQVQIYYVDLDGNEAHRIWTSLKPITADKQQAEEASNMSTLIENMIQTSSKLLLDISGGKLPDTSLNSEARKIKAKAKKYLDQNLSENDTSNLNQFINLIAQVSSHGSIGDEVAAKLRNFQASGVQPILVN